MAQRYEPFDWYATPLYYDVVFDEDTALEADFLEAVHASHGRSRGQRVLEPACGSGRLVDELAGRGWRVTGFDAADGMLRFARERLAHSGRRARLVRDRLESFHLRGSFDLAHCTVSTFKYLLDEADARRHLERVAQHLAPGGLYVLGLHLTDYDDRTRSRERWTGERDGVSVVCNIQGWPADRRRRRERVRSRLVVTERSGDVRRYETEWTFRTYSAGQLRRLLASVPALEHVATHDFAYDARETRALDDTQLDVVLVLRRRAERP